MTTLLPVTTITTAVASAVGSVFQLQSAHGTARHYTCSPKQHSSTAPPAELQSMPICRQVSMARPAG
jgi:hypothetical protein